MANTGVGKTFNCFKNPAYKKRIATKLTDTYALRTGDILTSNLWTGCTTSGRSSWLPNLPDPGTHPGPLKTTENRSLHDVDSQTRLAMYW